MVAPNASNKHTSTDDGQYYTWSLIICDTIIPANSVKKLCTVSRTSAKILQELESVCSQILAHT